MAIFNSPQPAKKDAGPMFPPEPAPAPVAPTPAAHAQVDAAPRPAPVPAQSTAKESLIASDLSIEGKIEGAGHVRIAGRFKGDVNVQGDLTIEQGAKLNGGVRANRVSVAGELEGNIEQASRVELLDSSAVNGDIKAETLTVAAGSRIRGHVDCGWNDAKGKANGNGSGNGRDHDA